MNKFVWAGLAAWFSVAQAVAGEVTVSQAWARATAPGQDAGVVALHITSQQDASIIAVSSPVSNSAEIHSMVHENGMMKMRAMDSLALKAKQEVVLGDGGNHLMLIGLKKPLKAGETVMLTVTVQFADKRKEQIEVKAKVKPLTESHDEHMHMHM
jgi:hypothetical protein